MLETRLEAYQGRLPRVDETLGRSNIDDLIARKLEYDALLNNIEQSNDWLALATEEEFEMWGEITSLEQNPALAANIPEAAEVRDKIDLLKGVLQWQLEREFGGRLWQVRRNLRETGESLVETQRARRQIDETMRTEPQKFADFSDRVYGLGPIQSSSELMKRWPTRENIYSLSPSPSCRRKSSAWIPIPCRRDLRWQPSMTRHRQKKRSPRNDSLNGF